jgi:hypothetical protein
VSSIYVAIPSIKDSELVKTIIRCLNKSSKLNEINIGVAVFLFEEELNDPLFDLPYKNVKIKNFDRNYYKGVGIARKESMSFYNGEDYILMIDSHCEFKENWDLILIDKLKYLKDKKGLITCYPPEYKYIYKNFTNLKNDWKNIYVSNFVEGYIKQKFDHEPDCIACNEFSPVPLWEEKRIENKDNDFILNKKISAGMLFADKRFAEEYEIMIPYNYSFFEEELIMSIEALNLGWTFYAPTDYVPIAHLYAEDINEFGGDRSALKECEVVELNTKQNYLSYVLDPNNKDKIIRFEKHAGIDILNRAEFEKRKVEK